MSLKKVELVLGYKQSLARMKDPEGDKKDAEFQGVKNSILEQHKYVCAGCGFRSAGKVTASQVGIPETKSGFLEVHHLDDDHGNNKPDNLVPLCPFCHQVFHCGFAGSTGTGIIGFLPEITQAHLNLMTNACLSILAIQEGKKDYLKKAVGVHVARAERSFEETVRLAESANQILQLFNVATDRMVARYGSESKSAKVFANILSEMAKSKPGSYARRKYFLAPFRLIPSPDYFRDQITFWSHNVWSGIVDGAVRGADFAALRRMDHERR